MGKQKKAVRIVVIVAVILVLALAAIAVYRFFAPSNVKASPDLGLKENQIALLVDGEQLETTGEKIDGVSYVPAEVASKYMDQRIYVDTKEKLLLYAMQDGMIQAKADATAYTVGKDAREAEHPILSIKDDQYYVALDFIKEHMSNEVEEYSSPDRLVIHSSRTRTYTMATVNSAVRLRKGPGKKYAWYTEAAQGDSLVVNVAAKEENDYVNVTTMDGITGYVPAESVTAGEEKTWEFKKTPASFTQESLGQTVCLGWHQFTNETAASKLYSGIADTKSMNVISPTLFALSDNKGNFTSLADTSYVTQAHERGLKVWGLINDFSKKINLDAILGTTSVRTRLVNRLVGEAISYDLDGINIDFEKIKASNAAGYLQFLRELVLKAHVNNLVVSVDNYTPADYNSYYDLAEQGRVVDYVILMAYDEHYAGSEEAGSVSSINFVKDGVKEMLAQSVPAERLVVALPFYTRLWHEKKSGSGVKVTSTAYGMSGAESVVRSHDATPKWDKETEQYYAQFKGDGGTYKIWMEDENSLKKKLEVVTSSKAAGVAFWKLGFERAATWLTIQEALK